MLNEGRRRARSRHRCRRRLRRDPTGAPAPRRRSATSRCVPRRVLEHRGATFEEMDIDALLARKPDVALVDELAHTNVPGSRNEKRWQDVDELLDAGIDVISTVNIQHLESVNDVVERITGVKQRETVPDEVVRQADQVELVDMTPEALRRRMAHGNIYPAERIDPALTNYFRPGNLAALRELALLWVADRSTSRSRSTASATGSPSPWETRERVLVALTGAPGTESLIRRAARVAQRAHGELLGVHVRGGEGLAGGVVDHARRPSQAARGPGRGVPRGRRFERRARRSPTSPGSRTARSWCSARAHRSRWQELLPAARSSTGSSAHSGPIDVHVISHEPERRRRRCSRRAGRDAAVGVSRCGGRSRAWLIARWSRWRWSPRCWRSSATPIGLPGVLLIYMLVVVVVAVIGGTLPAIGDRRRRVPARELVLHAADPYLDDRRSRERAGPGGLRDRRRDREHGRGDVGAAVGRRRTRPGRGRDPGAARRDGHVRRPAARPRRAPALVVRRWTRSPSCAARTDVLGRGDGRRVRRSRTGPSTPTWSTSSRPTSCSRCAAASSPPTTAACSSAFGAQLAAALERSRLSVGGRVGRRARADERAAHRVAPSGVARPPHAARRDQGVGVEPAPGRRRVGRRRRPRSSSKRSRSRPTGSRRSSRTCST